MNKKFVKDPSYANTRQLVFSHNEEVSASVEAKVDGKTLHFNGQDVLTNLDWFIGKCSY